MSAKLLNRLAELEAALARESSERQHVEKLLVDERVQMSRMFELFDRDRRLLGFEIHDGIVQELTAAIMCLQAGLAELESHSALVPDALSTCERLVAGCINEARRLMCGLQPPQLSELGLTAALRWRSCRSRR